MPSDASFPHGYSKRVKCPLHVCQQTLLQTDFWVPTFSHHAWLGLFTAISFEKSFQSCCKIWIHRLGFDYGSCMMAIYHIFWLQLGNSWTSSCRDNGLGRRGQTAWPPCSPDFNPLHFYLWRHLKSTVYATDFSKVQDLQQRIQNGSDTIRTIPGIFFFRRVRQSLHRRATSCIEA